MAITPRAPLLHISTMEEPACHESIIQTLNNLRELPVTLEVIGSDGVVPYTGSRPIFGDGNVYHVRHVGRCNAIDEEIEEEEDEEDEESGLDPSQADLRSVGFDYRLTISTERAEGFWWVTGVYAFYSLVRMDGRLDQRRPELY